MLILYLGLLDTDDKRSKAEAVYLKYRKLMKYIALGILKNDDLAEDAVADALLSLVKNIDRIDDVDSPDTKSFVYIVVKYASYNINRKIYRRGDVSLEEYQCPLAESKAFEQVFANECMREIGRLSDELRDVLELKTYYGLSTKEISQTLHVNEALVRKRLQRARQMLKGRM